MGEGDAKEELVGHSPEGNRFRFEHGSESKSKRDNVKKWEKVMRRKGWLGGLQRAIKVTVPLEYINGLTRYPEVSLFSQNGRLPHDFSPEFLAEKIKECKVKERQTALKSACWFRSRKLMARKAANKIWNESTNSIDGEKMDL